MNPSAPKTLLDRLRASLAATLRVPDGEERPAAVLWTDADGQWLPLVHVLGQFMPELFQLGDYQPEHRVGPVIWLRCIVDRTLDNPLPPGTVPVLYLPRVSRQILRAGGECPPLLQPLIELQYRGVTWHQRNGRDWTVDAFVMSEDGCGLDLAQDTLTRQALLRALPLVAVEPLANLRGRRLEANDFDALAVSDPVRELLSWISDPEGFEMRCEPPRWQTFCDVCKRDYGFDPDHDGVRAAADALINSGLRHDSKWENVWGRFAEAPTVYPGVADCLRDAQPELLVDHSRLPLENERAEESLRADLEAVCSLSHADACARVLELEKQHGPRRQWVWALQGRSPVAGALEPLARLAGMASHALGGPDVPSMVAYYADEGWRCDAAALEALELPLGIDDANLVSRLVRALYCQWLDRSARRFQELMAAADPHALATGVEPEKDCCVLFVDGLRYDIGARLREVLEQRELRVKPGYRIAPLPTVTATAKVMASPAHAAVTGVAGTEDFNPKVTASDKPLDAQRLRDAMAQEDVEIIGPDETRVASPGNTGGWSETGELDSLGHKIGARLAGQVRDEVERIAARIVALLDAGWRKVRVVTDHGWLLLPDGLPKVDLPKYLVATRWARCATVAGDSATDMPVFPWHWNRHVRIASPPGVACFASGKEYAHGGVSLQECVVPELIVERGKLRIKAKIESFSWRGMRCRVSATPGVSGLNIDLRLAWKRPETSIAVATKPVVDGEASLACADDGREGAAASVVLLDAAGQVLDHKPTTVGEQ
jgi:hypothetical protein